MKHKSLSIAASLAVTLAWFSGCAPAPPDPIPEFSDKNLVQNVRDTATSGGGGGGGPVKKSDGWGTLTGTIRLSAAAPAPRQMKVDKDRAVCGKFESQLVDESLISGPGNGLRDVLVFLRTKTAVHESHNATAAADVVLDNLHCRFEPHLCLVRLGQTLVVKNSDDVGHNTKVVSFVGNGFNETVAKGQPLRKSMVAPEREPIPVSCEIHSGWMSARMMVLDHPYMQKTDANGKFIMEHVPAGVELEFQVWHERAPRGLSGNSPDISVNDRGRFKVTVPKDGKSEFVLTVPLSAVSR